MTGLRLRRVSKSFGPLEVIKNVDLEINSKEFVVFVGPSGCGKSTLLRMIAGLEEVSSGDIEIGGQRVNDVDPSQRGIAMVFQTYALYPHMTVRDNMGFSLRFAGVPKPEIAKQVDEAARMLELGPLMDRRPKELSGGQRQRVAIGRAIVRHPQVFLFDEPLSNLDAELRVHMRIEISRLHKKLGVTMIYVTHDQVEAMTLADKIVVLRAGNIEQIGKPLELYDDPDNRFVAGFIGSPKMNFLNGSVAGYPDAATIGIRPEHIVASKDGGTWGGTVTVAEHVGSDTFLYVSSDKLGDITVRSVGELGVEPGDRISMSPEPGRLHRFDANGKAIRR